MYGLIIAGGVDYNTAPYNTAANNTAAYNTAACVA
jgi:hypothetical protein